MAKNRTYRRENYTLIQRPHPMGDGRAYDVYTSEGVLVGMVGTYMATMERRSPGKRYVNARWQSERWYMQPMNERAVYLAHETPGYGAIRLVARANAGTKPAGGR